MGKNKDKSPKPVEAEDSGSDQEVAEAAEGMKGLALNIEYNDAQKANIEALKKLHESKVELEKAYEEEMNALRLKYEKQYEPLYVQRSEVLKKDTEGPGKETSGTPGVPNFWLTAFKNHRQLSGMIEPHDEPVLAYLTDVTSKYLDEKEQRSFTMTFTFAANPYFEPEVLTKTYNLEGDGDSDVLQSTKATAIQWKAGKNITKKTVTRKQKNKRTKQVRTITQEVDAPSFFNFFKDHEIPSEEDLEKMKDEDVEQLEMLVDADYTAGTIIRDKIIPKAVAWFTGEAEDSDDESDYDFEGDDDDDEGLDDDDEDDDDESPKKPAKGGKGGKGAPAGANQQDCKTQ